MKLTRLVVPVAALLALAGCGPSPSAAADVAGTRISESALTQAVDGCAAFGVDLTRPEMLRFLVVGEAVRATARDHGVNIDQSEVDLMINSDPQAALMATDPACKKAVEANVVLSLLAPHMDETELVDHVSSLDIEVNPRYGAWDPVTATVGGSGSLSVPADQ